MSVPLILWAYSNFPSEIQNELFRRSKNRSFNYVDNTGDPLKYLGPTTAWVRITSFGIGRPSLNKKGFVLYGGKGFYDTYGFTKDKTNVIGYTPQGIPHIIENDLKTSNYPIHVPSPEIASLSATIQKGLFAKVTANFMCYSWKQLEYMTPYFLVPRITVLVEYGNNNFAPSSLVNIQSLDDVKKVWTNPYPLYSENILGSNGNYNVVFGQIFGFNWSIDGQKINCSVEVVSKDRLYAGLPVNLDINEKDKPNDEIKTPLTNLITLVKKDFIKNIKTISKETDFSDKNPKLKNIRELATICNEMNKEYVYGVFYGRDKAADVGDFDHGKNNTDVWVNMGFLVSLMNHYSSIPINIKTSTLNSQDNLFFEVNVDDVVISAHPNLISCDGRVLLIPNSEAPKYQYGQIGEVNARQKLVNWLSEPLGGRTAGNDYLNQYLDGSRRSYRASDEASNNYHFADKQLRAITSGMNVNITPGDIFRDDLDELINENRGAGFYRFPVRDTGPNNDYLSGFHGYFKDLYFNLQKFIDIINENGVKTYYDVYNRILAEITTAACNTWDFYLVAGTGTANGKTAPMKIIDRKFFSATNFADGKNKVYSFDYYDADSLIQGLSFKAPLSNLQALRSIYAQTNNTDEVSSMSDDSDLLNYQFKDQILNDTNTDRKMDAKTLSARREEMQKIISSLQMSAAPEGTYQMTTYVSGKPYIRRLVLPDATLLKFLLNDEDYSGRNCRYFGVQPNITAELVIQGIAGLRVLQFFQIRNLPEPYSDKNIIFQIMELTDTIQNNKWETTIKAGLMPLRNYMRSRMGLS